MYLSSRHFGHFPAKDRFQSAAKAGKLDDVTLFINEGAQVYEEANGWPTVLWSAIHGHCDILKFLLSRWAVNFCGLDLVRKVFGQTFTLDYVPVYFLSMYLMYV
jgi:hypothetical protein